MVPHFSADEEERLRQKWEISAKGKYYNHPDLNYYYERMLGITDITNYDKELYSDTKVLDMDFLRKCPKEVRSSMATWKRLKRKEAVKVPKKWR